MAKKRKTRPRGTHGSQKTYWLWPFWPLVPAPCAAGAARCGSLRGVLKCRVPRVLVTGLLLAVGVAGLAGCRTSPEPVV